MGEKAGKKKRTNDRPSSVIGEIHVTNDVSVLLNRKQYDCGSRIGSREDGCECEDGPGCCFYLIRHFGLFYNACRMQTGIEFTQFTNVSCSLEIAMNSDPLSDMQIIVALEARKILCQDFVFLMKSKENLSY